MDMKARRLERFRARSQLQFTSTSSSRRTTWLADEGVETLKGADALSTRLCAMGYSTSAEFNASLSDRRWFMRWADVGARIISTSLWTAGSLAGAACLP
jgi:hypothetical protein